MPILKGMREFDQEACSKTIGLHCCCNYSKVELGRFVSSGIGNAFFNTIPLSESDLMQSLGPTSSRYILQIFELYTLI